MSQGSGLGGGSCGHLAGGLSQEPVRVAPTGTPVDWGNPALPRRRGQRCSRHVRKAACRLQGVTTALPAPPPATVPGLTRPGRF